MYPDESDWLDAIFYDSKYRLTSHKPNRVNPSWPGNPCCEISMISEPAYLNNENKEEETMTKLYKADIPLLGLTYVTLIGRDGADYVVKVSDTDKLAAVKQIIEVMPNTIGIRFNSAIGGGAASKTYHFLVDDLSKFALGDIIIPAGSNDMATVVEFDSKNSFAQKKLTGRRVMTQPI
jgi:hypothetical protein